MDFDIDVFVQEIISKLKNFDNLKDEDGCIDFGHGFVGSLRYHDDPAGERTFRIDYGTDRVKNLLECSTEDWEEVIKDFVLSQFSTVDETLEPPSGSPLVLVRLYRGLAD